MSWRTHLALISAVALCTGCGGGAAGDAINSGGENTLGASRVEPFVGVWQLRSGWSTHAVDEALLVIRAPTTPGQAEVVLYDLTDEADAISRCYREPFGNGEAVDSLTNEVFLNFSEFNNGIISSVNENTMLIEFEDNNDVNNNGNTSERVSTTLTRVEQVEADISPLCSGS